MIGILDSGLGGLSVLNEVHRLLPDHSTHYVADSAWCPYGSKTYPEIQSRVTTLTDYLISKGAEIVVVACNSATIACVEHLRSNYLIPIVGMEPGVKPAAQLSQNGIVGVMATEASLAGEKFHRLVTTHAQGVQVITQPCPKFVKLVERGELSGEVVESAIHEYMSPMIEADTIVLGCTHYPFLKPVIEQLYPQKSIIDTGLAVAQQVARRISPITPSKVPHVFQTSGNQALATALLPVLCPQISGTVFGPLGQ